MKLTILIPLLLCSGCITRTIDRFDPTTGKLISHEQFSSRFVRGEADKLTEAVTQSGTNYTRRTSIGKVVGESELDKVPSIVEATAAGVTRGLVHPAPNPPPPPLP